MVPKNQASDGCGVGKGDGTSDGDGVGAGVGSNEKDGTGVGICVVTSPCAISIS